MKVKALCNVLYNGKMYMSGTVFETDDKLNNVEIISEGSGEKPDASGSTVHLSDLFGTSATEKSTRGRKSKQSTAEE